MTQYRGANLAGYGAQSAYDSWPVLTGPVSGTHYLGMTNAEMDYYLAKGCNIFRLMFAWEALQPTEYAGIGNLVGNFATYRNGLYAAVEYLTSKGADVILDIHGAKDSGFAGYKGVVVGKLTPSGQKPEDLLENLWWQLASRFKANTKVHYGVTNEPHDMPAATWFVAAQKVINGIRRAGATSTIFMPGTDWTGADSWMTNNALAWNLVDPLNNLQVQLHLYLDANSGGGTSDVVSATIGVDRLKAAVVWARSKKLKIFLGEIGISATALLGPSAWFNLCSFMEVNLDVISGWAFWAAGPTAWWKNYRFTLCPPSPGVDSPQMKMIQPALQAPPVPVDPAIVKLQDQVDDLTAELKTASDANTAYMLEVTSLTSTNGNLVTSLFSANNQISMLNSILSKIKALIP